MIDALNVISDYTPHMWGVYVHLTLLVLGWGVLFAIHRHLGDNDRNDTILLAICMLFMSIAPIGMGSISYRMEKHRLGWAVTGCLHYEEVITFSKGEEETFRACMEKKGYHE